MNGMSIDFEKFEEGISNIDAIEESRTAEELQYSKDLKLTNEIMRKWENTSKVSEHSPEEYARLMRLFVSNLCTSAKIYDGYDYMFDSIEKVNRVAVKKRVL